MHTEPNPAVQTQPAVEEVQDPSTQNVAIARGKIGAEAPMVVNHLTDATLYSGLFGTLDSARLQRVTEKILAKLAESEAEIVIIDLGNVDIIDSAVAAHLTRLAETINTTGSKSLFCGINPTIAQTMASTGINLKAISISKNLKSALKEVFRLQGLELVPRKSLNE